MTLVGCHPEPFDRAQDKLREGSDFEIDSAENPLNASTRLSMNGKTPNGFHRSSVRPEALEG